MDKLNITGHPQTEVSRCLKRQKLLAFLVPVNRTPNNNPGNRINILSPGFISWVCGKNLVSLSFCGFGTKV